MYAQQPIDIPIKSLPSPHAVQRVLSAPATSEEIARYVYDLLTRKEEEACERATD